MIRLFHYHHPRSLLLLMWLYLLTVLSVWTRGLYHDISKVEAFTFVHHHVRQQRITIKQQQQQQQQQHQHQHQKSVAKNDLFLSMSSSPSSSSTTTTSNIANKNAPKLPRDVKDAVTKCRAAVQEALRNKCSRMIIEMPVGVKFGVEKTYTATKKKKNTRLAAAVAEDDGNDSNSGSSSNTPTREMLDQSDRELARLFVEMFQPVGNTNIAVIFNNLALADLAKSKYGYESSNNNNNSVNPCHIMAIDRKDRGNGNIGKKKRRQKKKVIGFAAKLAAEVDDDISSDGGGGGNQSGPFDLPSNTEVAIFVAPGAKELIQVERICNKVGMGTLVILLNARLLSSQQQEQESSETIKTTKNIFQSEEAKKLFTQEFDSIFTLTAAPQQYAPNCLLYRNYPSSWVVARKPKVGPPKPILVQDTKPTNEECQKAYDSLELNDVEKGIENVLENVANWLN